ncbi:hypothetical protein GmHk_19G055448 [Glycine max]|nr:hypothetical protein GmHk_19G055448 [Glycine max]
MDLSKSSRNICITELVMDASLQGTFESSKSFIVPAWLLSVWTVISSIVSEICRPGNLPLCFH